MPSHLEGINANEPEFKSWMPAEYEAGYEARFADASESLTATHCWKAGWQDADTELTESSRQQRDAEGGQEEQPEQTWWQLYDIGGDARVHGIPFGEDRTEPWKLGWIDVDIRLGTIGKTLTTNDKEGKR
jgi:hypothetical protein